MLRRRGALLVLAASLGLAVTAGPSHARVADWHQGMTFASWRHDDYQKPSTLKSLDQLAGLGANWIAVVPHWYMKDKRSTRIYAETNAGTASDASVRHIIKQAHARGLKVLLKPHVDPRDGAWRGSISPSSADAWFSSYRDFMRHYARIASETGVEMLSVGCEYKSMSGSAYTRQWRSVVSDVRRVYRGPLTYSANWGPKSWGEYTQVQWWDALDYIGIDAYFPITRAQRPTVARAKAGWYSYTDRNGQTHRWVDDMKALSQKFGKKVLFTELGFNTVLNPGAEWEVQTGTDQTGAKNLVEATFQVFDQEPWMAGIFWWTWSVDPGKGGSRDRGMNISNKPMATAIADWYRRGGVASRPTGGSSGTTPRPPSRPTAGGTTPRPPSRPTTSAAVGRGFDFESGTQGWGVIERLTKLWTSGDVRAQGRQSLGVWADRVSRKTPGYARVKPPSSVRPGSVVSARVYLDASASNVQARLYTQDTAGKWVSGSSIVSLPGRKWTQIAVRVPSGLKKPLLHLGLQLMTKSGSFSGPVYLDDVRW